MSRARVKWPAHLTQRARPGSLREAYDTLQVETQRLFQLALSEVTSAPAAQEKLQRRYEELRSASQVAEGPRSTEGGVVNAKDSAVNDKHTTVRSGTYLRVCCFHGLKMRLCARACRTPQRGANNSAQAERGSRQQRVE